MQARASGFGALEPPPGVVSLALLKFLKAYHICSFGFIQINESVKRVFMEVRVLDLCNEQQRSVTQLFLPSPCCGLPTRRLDNGRAASPVWLEV